LEAKQRQQKRHQALVSCSTKLGLDFGAEDVTEERAMEKLLLEDTAGGHRRAVDGPLLSNAHLFT